MFTFLKPVIVLIFFISPIISFTQLNEADVLIYYSDEDQQLKKSTEEKYVANLGDEEEFIYIERLLQLPSYRNKKVNKVWKIEYNDNMYINLSNAHKLDFPNIFAKLDITGQINATTLDSSSILIQAFTLKRKKSMGYLLGGVVGDIIATATHDVKSMSQNRNLKEHIFRNEKNEKKVILAHFPPSGYKSSRQLANPKLRLINNDYLQRVFKLDAEKIKTISYEGVIELIEKYNIENEK